MNPAIQVRGLSKRYHLGVIGRQSLQEEIAYWWHRARGRNPRDHMGKLAVPGKAYRPPRASDAADSAAGTFWALDDVTFDVQPGEVLGVIGRNGAGKSTLLKILSRITEPTSGEAFIEGRIGSLLEIGTGFHPELTGRENIYMNGTILGMKKAEVDRKFDEIVAFSEIEKFLDTPVKRYSSGMYVRLAFAVAAHLEPEILIVDEVLAVGDAAFQKKCLGKMSDDSTAGRPVLFVSHNMTAMQGLCSRVIWLHEGKVAKDGPAEEIVEEYQRTAFSELAQQTWDDKGTAPGNDKVRLRSARVHPEAGSPSDPITVRTAVAMEFEVWNLRPDVLLNLRIKLTNEQGVAVFTTVSCTAPGLRDRPLPAGLFRFTCRIPGDLLNDGVHRVSATVVQDHGVTLFYYVGILAFEVLDSAELRGSWHGKWAGAVRPNLEWTLERVPDGD